MLTLAMIIGLWSTSCIQTQISNVNQGYSIESYEFQETGDFTHTRQWYNDSQCKELLQTEERAGTLEIGHKLKVFVLSGVAFAADYNTSAGTDLGAISLKDKNSLLLSRGVSNSYIRNAMLSLFPYYKIR